MNGSIKSMKSMNIRPQPEGTRWTAEQWQAICAKGNNILVAAAAGSGKTAVLVERIIRKIVDPDHPEDVDRLLIVTFTNAAAAEMKNRIGAAIEQQLQQHPSSLHLRRQLSLLNRAHISTLHAFCMGVVRKFYYKVDIDPNFRIVDETEGELIREEIMEELFEAEYGGQDNEAFFDLVDRYSGDRSDDTLRTLVRKLYDFSRSHPSPDRWLDEMADRYKLQDAEKMEDLPWTAELLSDVRLRLNGVLDQVEKGMAYAQTPGGPYPYADTFAEDVSRIRHLLGARNWDDLYERFQSFTFGKLKAVRKSADMDEDLKERAKAFRERAKKQMLTVEQELFSRHPDELLEDLQAMAPLVHTLVRLVKTFSTRYQAAKKEKALVDFADLEHLCLDILTEKSVENMAEDKAAEVLSQVPSMAALEYREHFTEVLVDEYQDTNLVQETILQLLSTGSNLFMVGDVKQSIYRFRLAEPGLFLEKYKRYDKAGDHEHDPGAATEETVGGTTGWRIDLAKNFRSRAEILDGTNFLFRQVMDEAVGEIAYDSNAELRLGNTEYPEAEGVEAELAVIQKGDPLKEDIRKGNLLTVQEQEDEPTDPEEELETAQLEARWIAKQVKRLIESPYRVFDPGTKQMRNVTYRDIVILMRSMPWAATMMEEFKQEGIPVYAELSGGYFEAVEVTVIMSLLKVIDNPYQDIPLAAVLRSPIVGLNERHMARIRMQDRNGPYYDGLKKTVQLEQAPHEAWRQGAASFYEQLHTWRTKARSGALSELIWQLFRETGYYDYVGGMPGGKQRQANLRALYDRARAYESTSFRGLFRFLRFIERMQERGDDLGTARALGEQEDVVRIMTIHKSKGLEFPVVFVAGMNKLFNKQDERANVLLHKELGFGAKYIDPKRRVAYPTLPQLAIKRRLHLESTAEEMRILYVALTRAKEKLFLVGTVRDAVKSIEKWREHVPVNDWLLPAAERLKANTYMDWAGPALLRHAAGRELRAGTETAPDFVERDPSRWHIQVIESQTLQQTKHREDDQEEKERLEDAVRQLQRVANVSGMYDEVSRRLEWDYEHQAAAEYRSKQTVSELKRELNDEYSDQPLIGHFRASAADRPRFLRETNISPAERGTAVHAVMQHIPLSTAINRETMEYLLLKMVADELLTGEEADSVDIEEILVFFASELGQRLLASGHVQREVPFSFALPASEVYRDWKAHMDDQVLVQGVVDCVFRDATGQLVLIDYKTDTISGRFPQGFEQAKSVLLERYRMQILLYVRALESIWKKRIHEAYLFFFDGAHVLEVNLEREEGFHATAAYGGLAPGQDVGREGPPSGA